MCVPVRALLSFLCYADELEVVLKDLQFLAAAGESDMEQHNGVLALIRSYLCLLKAEQQVKLSTLLHQDLYHAMPSHCGQPHDKRCERHVPPHELSKPWSWSYR